MLRCNVAKQHDVHTLLPASVLLGRRCAWSIHRIALLQSTKRTFNYTNLNKKLHLNITLQQSKQKLIIADTVIKNNTNCIGANNLKRMVPSQSKGRSPPKKQARNPTINCLQQNFSCRFQVFHQRAEDQNISAQNTKAWLELRFSLNFNFSL